MYFKLNPDLLTSYCEKIPQQLLQKILLQAPHLIQEARAIQKVQDILHTIIDINPGVAKHIVFTKGDLQLALRAVAADPTTFQHVGMFRNNIAVANKALSGDPAMVNHVGAAIYTDMKVKGMIKSPR